jgi:hypothetical protein
MRADFWQAPLDQRSAAKFDNESGSRTGLDTEEAINLLPKQ